MEENIVDFSKLTLAQQEEVRQNIRNQILTQKIYSYGREKIIVFPKNSEGKETGEKAESFKSGYLGNDNLQEIVDFKTIEDGLPYGCETWVKDEKYPIRQNALPDKVSTIAQFKKIFYFFIRFIAGKDGFSKKNIFQKVFIVLSSLQYQELILMYIWNGLRDVYTNPKYYSQPVREVYRIVKNGIVRDVLCALLEYDTAYRYPGQDIFTELDKKNLAKNPIGELKRLTEIMFSRERDKEGSSSRFKKVMWLIWLYLRLNRKLLKEIKNTLMELNINEIKLSKEDQYWTNKHYEYYDFRGVGTEMRYQEYLATKNN